MMNKGLDSETYHGNVKCLCTDSRCIEPQDIDEVLSFLRGQGVIYYCFNLRFETQSIIKLLPKENIIDLGTEGINKTEYKDVILSYIPKKRLSISYGKNAVHLYDIAQFYQGMTLDDAAKKYLHDEKSNIELDIDRACIGNEKGYYEANRSDILKYCMHDAELTLGLANFMASTFAKIGFENPEEPPISFIRPISVASVAEKWLLSRKQKFPKTPEWYMDEELFAYYAYGGGRFSTLQRGYFDQPLWDYDLNSAYPATMASLPNWYNGEFEKFDANTAMQYEDYEYTWALVKFDCPHIRYDSNENWEFEEETKVDDKWESIISKVRNSKIYYPSGERTQYLTGLDIDFLDRNGFPYEIQYGIGWEEKNKKFDNPFAWMPDFYEHRKKIKMEGDFAVQYAMKIFLNALYGKVVTTRHGFGKMTNFFYGSYITSDCRNKVNQIVVDNPGNVVNVATDGVLCTEKIRGIKISEKLGDWEENQYERGLVVGSGIRQLWKSDGTFVTYARGITESKNWDMYTEMKNNRDNDALIFEKERPVQLGEILNFGKVFKFSDLNRFMWRRKKMRANTDNTQNWERQYVDFGDFLDSKPMKSTPLRMEDLGGDKR